MDAISFTGESATGAAITKVAANGMREVSMELGGKNASLVFDDAVMDRVAEGMRRSAFFNAGQICFCTERAYVHRSRLDEFLTTMVGVAEAVVIGDKEHNGFNIGPLISLAVIERRYKNLLTVFMQRVVKSSQVGALQNLATQEIKGHSSVLPLPLGRQKAGGLSKRKPLGPFCT